jgi:DNA-binding NtrC family response regulator
VPTILVVDDDPGVRQAIGEALKDDHEVLLAGSLAEGREALARHPTLVLLDVMLGDGSGLELLAEARAADPDRAVVMISGESDIATALQATRLGAYDFLEKPLGRSKLRVTVRNALSAWDRTRDSRDLRADLLARWSFTGTSAAIASTDALLAKAAPSTLSVLVTGEHGTGKEIAARRLHALSPRWARPFVPVNCAAIPSELLESQLFGHVKGSFTGAHDDRRGLFQEADGGTLFLDEIGDMAPPLQAKLLRVLQQGDVVRLGETAPRRVDVRIVAATNRAVPELLASGQLRADLYHRIAAIELSMPALRTRPEDVRLLVHRFVEQFCYEINRRIPAIADEAWAALLAHPFPGNVRELENVVRRTLVLRDDDPIRAFLLGVQEAGSGHVGAWKDVKHALLRTHLEARLAAHGGNKKALAAELGVHANNLSRLFRAHGME